jgi:hypothetical protein
MEENIHFTKASIIIVDMMTTIIFLNVRGLGPVLTSGLNIVNKFDV